jgi:hypothetical protein
MSESPFLNQISNRNLLSPIGFKFILTKIPKVDFLCQTAMIPSISMGSAQQPSYLRDIPVPGDKAIFEDLTLRFLIDENMENYLQIYNWIIGLAYPETLEQFANLRKLDQIPQPVTPNDSYQKFAEYSDATLQILNSNFRVNRQIKFKNLFPVSLSTLDFDATNRDYNYFTATATFKYSGYEIQDSQGHRIDNGPSKY